MAVASPCINVCRMNAQTGLCEGCLRTLDEIASWGTSSDDERRAVWTAIATRRTQRAADAGACQTCGPDNQNQEAM